MPPSGTMTAGRRLRLDRRKAGLSQEGLAELLGVTKDDVSQMENNRQDLSTAAKAFSASPPARVPTQPHTPSPAREPADEPVQPLLGDDKDGPGPRVGKKDAAPRAELKPLAAPPSRGEIEELEAALLKLFAGEAFLVPRLQPDGTTIQTEAVIPGVAQMVGMVDEFDGHIIRLYAPGMARAWAELARENATVRKVLMGLTFGGSYRGVVAATLPAVLAIMAHHGMLPQLGGGGRVVEEVPPQMPPEHPAAAEPPLFAAEV